jgi:hypothetical protein
MPEKFLRSIPLSSEFSENTQPHLEQVISPVTSSVANFNALQLRQINFISPIFCKIVKNFSAS